MKRSCGVCQKGHNGNGNGWRDVPAEARLLDGVEPEGHPQIPQGCAGYFWASVIDAQTGSTHPDATPLKGFGGAGVLEVVEHHIGSTYRAVYTVKYAGVVYVLHVFQKKSKAGIKTPKEEARQGQEPPEGGRETPCGMVDATEAESGRVKNARPLSEAVEMSSPTWVCRIPTCCAPRLNSSSASAPSSPNGD